MGDMVSWLEVVLVPQYDRCCFLDNVYAVVGTNEVRVMVAKYCVNHGREQAATHQKGRRSGLSILGLV
jgi:hypothetical protein